MKKYIGIIVAEPQEMQAVKDLMNKVHEISICNLKIFKGRIGKKTYLLTRSGVGKVNSARTAQILIDNFKLEYIINVGSAGALNDNLNIGDIVIGKSLVQHDFDVTAFGRDKGYIPDTGKFFESDPKLIKKYQCAKIANQNIITGIIASGDIFCTDPKMKEKIRKDFGADCVEMEGASVAQVCSLNGLPFIVIRSISDTPNGNNQIDFNEYLTIASKNCANIIKT